MESTESLNSMTVRIDVPSHRLRDEEIAVDHERRRLMRRSFSTASFGHVVNFGYGAAQRACRRPFVGQSIEEILSRKRSFIDVGRRPAISYAT
uniref:Uncharacterized protein n=1 Tax=Romanomermis culicivorax TaxID=13658 RepID=A0A915HDT7_ROMCU